MTTIFQLLKQDLNEARKARDTSRVTALSTLIGEAGMIAKNEGSEEPNRAQVISLIRKTIAGLSEVGSDAARQETDLLEAYLPSQMTSEQLSHVLAVTVTRLGATSMKDMKKVLAELASTLPGQYDPKQASEVLKGMLG